MSAPLSPIRFLYRAAELFGNATGVVCGQKSFTWTEFTERCERLASALSSGGIAEGDRVAFLSFNCHQLLEGYYAVPLLRAVVMPLNVRLAPAELAEILNHAEARALFYDPEFESCIESFRQHCPSLTYITPLNGEYEALIQSGVPGRHAWETIDEEAPAEIFYTSGSTGSPKGVVLSHRALYLHALHVALLYGDVTTMVDLHTIPLFHANGWGRAHASVMLGVKQVMVRRFDPAAVLLLIEQHRATDMNVVPTMANALLNCPDAAGHDLTSIRCVTIGGAASSPELIRRLEGLFPNADIFAGYGLTETAPVLTTARPKPGTTYASDEDRWTRRAMTGWPITGVELRVVDLEMRDVPKDGSAIGEIIARGDHMMSEYYRDPVATAQAFAGGWFHTGDMAVWYPDDFINIVDRRKEIIVSGGENISSIEVERAIAAHPDVIECAVVAAPDPRWGEVPAALVVPRSGTALDTPTLLAFLAGRLGKFKMPRVVEFTSEPLPKTGTGKIRKLDIRERFWAGHDRRVGD